MTKLDDTDRAILRALGEDATLSAGALGRRFGLSQPAAWRRVKRLHEAGVIRGRRVDLDLEDAAPLGNGMELGSTAMNKHDVFAAASPQVLLERSDRFLCT